MARAKSTGAPRGPIPRTVTQQVTFQDYAGNPAVSIWQYTEGSPWQPGFSYQVYVTAGYGYNDAGSTLPTDLLQALIENQNEVETWRLDLYFLPRADADACMEHYRREKAHRQGAEMHTLPSYEGTGCWHHNVLFILDDERWKERGLEVIKFDRVDFEDDPDDPLGISEQEAHREPTVHGVGAAMLAFWKCCRLRHKYEHTFWVDDDDDQSGST